MILGVGLAPTNVARTSNKGIDGQLGFQTRLGQVDFNTNFVFSYAKIRLNIKRRHNKISMVGSDWKPIGQTFGYTCLGYYTPEDIEK